MPSNEAQWGWFLFYTGGAMIAWVWFSVVLVDLAIHLRRTKRAK